MYKFYQSIALRNTALSLALTAVLLPAGAVQRPQNRPPPLVISSVTVDTANGSLKIAGHGFGAASPSVRLGKHALQVQDRSETGLVATLPEMLQLGTYRLRVIGPGSDPLRQDSIDVTLSGLPHPK